MFNTQKSNKTKQKHTIKRTKKQTKKAKQTKPNRNPHINQLRKKNHLSHTSSSTGPTAPCSPHAWAPAKDEQAALLFAFSFPEKRASTICYFKSLPEARTMVQNVHNYMFHMRHQAGISLLVLSIYFDKYWEVYNERLCFFTFYEAPNCHGFFYSQCLTVWCWI